MLPHLYYNEHYQYENFIDRETVGVTLGKVHLAYNFSYEITNGTIKNKGVASGYVNVDGKNFIKALIIKNGVLEWDPTSILDMKIF